MMPDAGRMDSKAARNGALALSALCSRENLGHVGARHLRVAVVLEAHARRTPLLGLVTVVVPLRPDEQVLSANTDNVLAGVEHATACGHSAEVDRPRNAVCDSFAVALLVAWEANLPVAKLPTELGALAGPFAALAGLVDLAPKTSNELRITDRFCDDALVLDLPSSGRLCSGAGPATTASVQLVYQEVSA